MITVISGGSESLKLIRALRHFLDDNEIAVVANTSDAIWIDGTLASPDIDDLIFLFSGILNTSRWHGVRGDTFATCLFYNRYFEGGIIPVGDKERAVHIARATYLSEGASITQATEEICRRFGICARIIPATDTSVELSCLIGDETVRPIDLRQRTTGNELEIIDNITIDYFNEPALSPDVSSTISGSDAVIIGPGCTMTSILPVIACKGIQDLLKEKFTIAFAPRFPEKESESALSNYNRVMAVYRSFSDLIIQNTGEDIEIERATRLNTKMTSRHSAESLAWDLMSVIRSHGNQIA